jgi:hypothetical protein
MGTSLRRLGDGRLRALGGHAIAVAREIAVRAGSGRPGPGQRLGVGSGDAEDYCGTDGQ